MKQLSKKNYNLLRKMACERMKIEIYCLLAPFFVFSKEEGIVLEKEIEVFIEKVKSLREAKASEGKRSTKENRAFES